MKDRKFSFHWKNVLLELSKHENKNEWFLFDELSTMLQIPKESKASVFSHLQKEGFVIVQKDVPKTNVKISDSGLYEASKIAESIKTKSLNMDKLILEIEDLNNRTNDYEETKSNAKLAIKISIAAILVTVILQVLEWLCTKQP